MSRPFKLYRLQQLDSQLDWLRNRLQEIEKALAEDTALRQAIQQAEETINRLQEARKNLRRAEEKVHDLQIKIEQTESTLYGGKVRNPKELRDLENDLTSMKRYLEVLEERQLEAMLAEEEAQASNAAVSAELEKTRAQFQNQQDQLLTEQTKIKKEIAVLETERQAATASILPEDLVLYQQIRTQRRGIAVAKVNERACSACGSILNTALLHAAHFPSQITRCDTCGRILYVG